MREMKEFALLGFEERGSGREKVVVILGGKSRSEEGDRECECVRVRRDWAEGERGAHVPTKEAFSFSSFSHI